MTNCSILSAVTAFFLATNLLVCIKTAEPDTTSISTSLPETSTDSSINSNIEPSTTRVFRPAIAYYFSPDMFSHPDPTEFFLAKATNNAYSQVDPIRENLGYTPSSWKTVINNVDYYLKKRELPRTYLPYARLLKSLLTCLSKLHRVSTRIRALQQKYSVEADYPSPPAGISTPELRDLFSTEVFSDPNIPSVLAKKIIKIPDDRIADVTADLVKVLDKHNYVLQAYYEYMHFLRIFFQSKDDIYRLRHEDAEIRRRFKKTQNKTSNAD